MVEYDLDEGDNNADKVVIPCVGILIVLDWVICSTLGSCLSGYSVVSFIYGREPWSFTWIIDDLGDDSFNDSVDDDNLGEDSVGDDNLCDDSDDNDKNILGDDSVDDDDFDGGDLGVEDLVIK